jgi:transcriptional regulator with XRE-family HTH domain
MVTTQGGRLREERLQLAMSQEAFGAIAGLTKQAVINYEKDLRSPDGQSLSAWAAAGADVLYILTGQRSVAVESRLSKRAQALLDNYEALSDDAKRNVENTVTLLAQPQSVKRRA